MTTPAVDSCTLSNRQREIQTASERALFQASRFFEFNVHDYQYNLLRWVVIGDLIHEFERTGWLRHRHRDSHHPDGSPNCLLLQGSAAFASNLEAQVPYCIYPTDLDGLVLEQDRSKELRTILEEYARSNGGKLMGIGCGFEDRPYPKGFRAPALKAAHQQQHVVLLVRVTPSLIAKTVKTLEDSPKIREWFISDDRYELNSMIKDGKFVPHWTSAFENIHEAYFKSSIDSLRLGPDELAVTPDSIPVVVGIDFKMNEPEQLLRSSVLFKGHHVNLQSNLLLGGCKKLRQVVAAENRDKNVKCAAGLVDAYLITQNLAFLLWGRDDIIELTALLTAATLPCSPEFYQHTSFRDAGKAFEMLKDECEAILNPLGYDLLKRYRSVSAEYGEMLDGEYLKINALPKLWSLIAATAARAREVQPFFDGCYEAFARKERLPAIPKQLLDRIHDHAHRGNLHSLCRTSRDQFDAETFADRLGKQILHAMEIAGRLAQIDRAKPS